MPKNQMVPTGTPSRPVYKELTAEEMSVISNIQSLLQEITSMAGGTSAGQAGVAAGPGGTAGQVTMEEEGGGAEGPGGANYHGPTFKPGSQAPSRVEGEEEEAEDDKYPDERMQGAPANAAPAPRTAVKQGKAAKAIIVGDPDASTGSSDADERIEDIPEWDEENVDEVAKAILRMALGHGVKKSARPQNPMVAVLAKIGEALNTVAKTQQMQGSVINDLLEGLGVAKGLEEAQPPAPRNRPVRTMPGDNANVMKELVNALLSVTKGGDAQSSVNAGDGLSQAERVHKDMGQIALALQSLAGDAWSPKGF